MGVRSQSNKPAIQELTESNGKDSVSKDGTGIFDLYFGVGLLERLLI